MKERDSILQLLVYTSVNYFQDCLQRQKSLGLFHSEYAPESDLPTLHVSECFIGFVKRKFFDHAFNPVKLGEVYPLLAIQRVTGWPALH